MTITVNLPGETEARLKEKADEAGLTPDGLVEQVLVRYLTTSTGRFQRLAAELGRPVDLADISRESIYAE